MNDNCTYSDEELQSFAINGDAQAEELLIKRYSRIVRALARPYFLAGGDSEDLIQEGMLGLISAVRSYDASAGASFRTYSELCIKRRLLTAIRNAAGGKSVSLNDCLSLESPLFDEELSQAAYAVREADLRGPEEMVIDREETDKFYNAFLCLLSGFEADVLGYYLDGMSYREIAEITDRPAKSVDNAVQRIRRKLAQFQRNKISDSSKG
jgi:RNA polymerase sporulation-specific sigma factor